MIRLADLPTPCLVLDRGKLQRNLAAMAVAIARTGVALRPHMKTAKSAEVAKLATAGHAGGITPAKLDRAAALRRVGIDLTLVTDDPAAAAAIIMSWSKSTAANTAPAWRSRALRCSKSAARWVRPASA